MPPKGQRDKFEEDWNKEWDADVRRDQARTEPPRSQFEELRHTERWLPPLLAQLDEAAVFIFRDAWPRLATWLRRSFPRAAEALPSERWAQIGWLALALAGVDWVVTLGPQNGHNVTVLLGWGLAGFAGWQIWRRSQLNRRDELAQRFVEHSAQLGGENIEARIAALGALDQLAFDNPRYRLPLVHLLAAWLEGRSAGQAGDHDGAVARQMLVEFRELLEAEPVPYEPVVVAPPAAAKPAATPAPAQAEPGSPGTIAGEPGVEPVVEPVVEPASEPVVALEVLETEVAPEAGSLPVAAPPAAEESAAPPARSSARRTKE